MRSLADCCILSELVLVDPRHHVVFIFFTFLSLLKLRDGKLALAKTGVWANDAW